MTIINATILNATIFAIFPENLLDLLDLGGIVDLLDLIDALELGDVLDILDLCDSEPEGGARPICVPSVGGLLGGSIHPCRSD